MLMNPIDFARLENSLSVEHRAFDISHRNVTPSSRPSPPAGERVTGRRVRGYPIHRVNGRFHFAGRGSPRSPGPCFGALIVGLLAVALPLPSAGVDDPPEPAETGNSEAKSSEAKPGEAEATEAAPGEYRNWFDVSVGGLLVDG